MLKVDKVRRRGHLKVLNSMGRHSNKGGTCAAKKATVERTAIPATGTWYRLWGFFASDKDFPRLRGGISYQYFVSCRMVIETIETLQDGCDGCSLGGIWKADKVSGLQEEVVLDKDRVSSRRVARLGCAWSGLGDGA